MCVQLSLNFIKPVQTGFPEDCDARLVVRTAAMVDPSAQKNAALVTYGMQALASNARQQIGAHAAHLCEQPSQAEQQQLNASKASTLFAWRQPVSPHVAVQSEGMLSFTPKLCQSHTQ